MKQITCVIMDWAGTAVDYGCFAPLNAFLKVFAEEKGIDITYRQAREPMGLLKIDHIKAILSMPEVAAKFQAKYNREWNMEDVQSMYHVPKFREAFVCLFTGFYHSDSTCNRHIEPASCTRY